MDWLSKRKFVIVCYEKVVRIPLEGDEILRVHGERTQGVVKTLLNTKTRVSYDLVISREEHQFRLLRRGAWSSFEVSVGITEEGEVVTYLRFIANFSKIVKPLTSLTERNQKYEWGAEREEAFQTLKNDLSQSKVFKQENVLAERLHGLDPQMERKRDESVYFMDRIWVLLVGSVMDEAHASRPPVLWVEIRESSLTGIELVQETTDKKGVAHFGKKGKLAPRYVGPFEILERIGLVAYRLRLSEELNSVHDTFHVSNLKKCLGNSNLHVPLNEIKIDKTLHFVEEPVEILDREIRSLKRGRISLVKAHWNSKRGLEFTWEREDHMKSKYP
ncbi:hypothetical protein Tco_0059923 [Tanacetum coccineum]